MHGAHSFPKCSWDKREPAKYCLYQASSYHASSPSLRWASQQLQRGVVPGRKETATMLTTYHCLNRHFLCEGSWFVIFLLPLLEVLEWQHHSLYPFTTGKCDIRRHSWHERRKSPVLCVSFYIRTRKVISLV